MSEINRTTCAQLGAFRLLHAARHLALIFCVFTSSCLRRVDDGRSVTLIGENHGKTVLFCRPKRFVKIRESCDGVNPAFFAVIHNSEPDFVEDPLYLDLISLEKGEILGLAKAGNTLDSCAEVYKAPSKQGGGPVESYESYTELVEGLFEGRASTFSSKRIDGDTDLVAVGVLNIAANSLMPVKYIIAVSASGQILGFCKYEYAEDTRALSEWPQY